MADAAAREFLQPALLDRLIDDARTSTIFELRGAHADLEALGIALPALLAALRALGLRPLEVDPAQVPEPAAFLLRFSAPGRTVGLAEVKNLSLRPTSAPARPVRLQACCEVTAQLRKNNHAAGVERRGMSVRRLRESVLRDLSALLNSISLDSSVDLDPYPAVARSVLNFGMPNLAGESRVSVDPARLAGRIQAVIENFEPRLSRVQVVPERNKDGSDMVGGLSFRVDAELWGEPVPQHLAMRTSIDLGSGGAQLDDLGGA